MKKRSSPLLYEQTMAASRHQQRFTVYINEGEKHQIEEWVKIWPNTHTGGDLFGAWKDTTVKLSPHWSPHSSSHSSTHSPHIRPTFIMRLYKQIKTTCGTLTISNHSKSLYLYIKLLAFQILYILV